MAAVLLPVNVNPVGLGEGGRGEYGQKVGIWSRSENFGQG